MPATSAPFTTLHPERKAARALTAEDLWNLPRVGAPEVFPDGTQAVVPVTRYDLEKNEGRTQLHVVSLTAPGGLSRPAEPTPICVLRSMPPSRLIRMFVAEPSARARKRRFVPLRTSGICAV